MHRNIARCLGRSGAVVLALLILAIGFAIPACGTPEDRSVRTYTPEQVSAAQKVMDNIRGLAKVSDTGTTMAVTFDAGVLTGLTRERMQELISAVANAGAVLVGRARRIDFYDPIGQRVGSADPVGGIKLTK